MIELGGLDRRHRPHRAEGQGAIMIGIHGDDPGMIRSARRARQIARYLRPARYRRSGRDETRNLAEAMNWELVVPGAEGGGLFGCFGFAAVGVAWLGMCGGGGDLRALHEDFFEPSAPPWRLQRRRAVDEKRPAAEAQALLARRLGRRGGGGGWRSSVTDTFASGAGVSEAPRNGLARW